MKNIKPVNGVMLDNGIILSYDDPNEFIEAWPGIFMMSSESSPRPLPQEVSEPSH